MDQAKSTPATEGARNNLTGPSKNIVDTAGAVEHLGIFAAGLRSAGLGETLAAKGPFTVFAPTDEALKKLPSGAYEALLRNPRKLKAILSYHVVSGYLMARDLKAGEVMTLQGSTLSLAMSSEGMQVNSAQLTQADVAATNGIIHAIDAVLLPKGWQLLAAA
jgi:uncharacterized surface protein with fasciclin (FAS1) repeats